MSRWKNIAVLAAATASVVAATGCGPTTASPEESPQSGVLELLTTDLQGSFQEAVEQSGKIETLRARMVASGPEDFEMQLTLDLRDPVSYEGVMDMEGVPTAVRMVDSAMYIEVPEAERESNDGKRWMKMDLSSAFATGMDLEQPIQKVDPVVQVKTLLGLEEVTVVGEETVDGTPTVHYTVTASTEEHLAMLEEQGEIDSAELANSLDEMAEFSVTEIKTDVWVDEQYWPRRARMTMGEIVITIDYTEYNEPVNIEVPPAAETNDFDALLEGLKELGAGS